MTDKLKPCPFCGCDELFTVLSCEDDCCDNIICKDCNLQRYAVCCDARHGGCGATSGYKDNEKEAIENWNRRADNDR